MKRLTFLILVGLLVMSAIAHAEGKGETPQTLLQRGHEAYYKNDLETAQKQYEAVLKSGSRSGHLFYDLANVYYREGRLGQAIQYYEKALRLLPRDADVRANLKFVNQKTLQKQIIESQGTQFLRKVFFWSSWLTLKETVKLALIIHILFWGALWIHMTLQKPSTKWISLIAGILFFIFSSSTAFKIHGEENQVWAIVLKPQLEVHPTFLEQQKNLMTLYQGSKVQVLSQQEFKGKEKWMQILLPDGQKGWVVSDSLGVI